MTAGDKAMSETPTPESDAEWKRTSLHWAQAELMRDHSAKMERERDHLKTALAAMVTHNEKEHRCHNRAHRLAVHALKATAGKGEVRP